jgi:hypothetical protein
VSPLDLLRERGVLPHAELVAAIAGEPVRGSWWGHPAGKAIWRAGVAIEESGEALVCKLAGGKLTFVHRRLWPALARVVTDPGWRAARIARLSPEARDLLARVEIAEVRQPPRKPREELERAMLADARQVHEGRHVTILRPWDLGPPLDAPVAVAIDRLGAWTR